MFTQLYSGITPNAETRTKTYHAILKTPLQYQPRTKIKYSDVDYMRNNFAPNKIAATEIHGNMTTRGHDVKFPGLRDYVLRGEVHDEKAYHSMNTCVFVATGFSMSCWPSRPT